MWLPWLPLTIALGCSERPAEGPPQPLLPALQVSSNILERDRVAEAALLAQLAVPPKAMQVKRALMDFEKDEDFSHLREARPLAAELVREQPGYPWGRFLTAFIERLLGDKAAEAAALDGLLPEERAAYFYYLRREPGAVLRSLRCLHIEVCTLERSAQEGSPRLDSPFSSLKDTEGTVECDGYRVEASTCPEDYSVLGRYAAISSSQRRLESWGPSAAGLDATGLGQLLGIAPGDDVADLGAGHGWFSFPFARLVGPEGSVTALEIDPLLIGQLRHAVRLSETHNLQVLRSPNSVGVTDGSLEWVFASEVLTLIGHDDMIRVGQGKGAMMPTLMKNIRLGLGPEGKLVVADLRVAFEPVVGCDAGAGCLHWSTLAQREGFVQIDQLDRIDGDFEVRVYQQSP